MRHKMNLENSAHSRKHYHMKLSVRVLRRSLKVRKDVYDERDYRISKAELPKALPNSASLKQYCMGVKNQGSLGSCTGFGTGASYEVNDNINKKAIATKSSIDVSELFIYYNSRLIEGTTSEDSGASVRDACKSIVKYGAGSESAWPYIISRFREKPDTSAYAAGKKTRMKSYYRCMTLYEVKQALAAGISVVFGMAVYTNYFYHGRGIYSSIGGSFEGGHCQLIVGYDDAKAAFLVRNSWGEYWGEEGYAWIGYAVFMELLYDAWAMI